MYLRRLEYLILSAGEERNLFDYFAIEVKDPQNY